MVLHTLTALCRQRLMLCIANISSSITLSLLLWLMWQVTHLGKVPSLITVSNPLMTPPPVHWSCSLMSGRDTLGLQTPDIFGKGWCKSSEVNVNAAQLPTFPRRHWSRYERTKADLWGSGAFNVKLQYQVPWNHHSAWCSFWSITVTQLPLDFTQRVLALWWFPARSLFWSECLNTRGGGGSKEKDKRRKILNTFHFAPLGWVHCLLNDLFFNLFSLPRQTQMGSYSG